MLEMVVTFEGALRIASEDIERRIENSARLSKYSFSHVELKNANDKFWTFVSGSEELQAEGVVPGALYASVDKTDGHLLTSDEVEQFYRALANHNAARSRSKV